MSEYENTERKPPAPDAPQLGKSEPSASDTKTEPNPHPTGDAALPDDQEPLGSGAAMFEGVSDEIRAYVGDDEALYEAMNLGVEHEGIEASQLLGLVIATLVAIAVLVVTVFYFLISPTVQGAQASAEQGELYPELASVRATGIALVNEYAVASPEEGTYRIPVADAERLVARRYGLAQQGMSGLAQPPAYYPLGGVVTTPAASARAARSDRFASDAPAMGDAPMVEPMAPMTEPMVEPAVQAPLPSR